MIYTGTKGKMKESGIEWVCQGKPLDNAKNVIIKTKTVPSDTYSISEEDLMKVSDITPAPVSNVSIDPPKATPTTPTSPDWNPFDGMSDEEIREIVARGGFLC